MKIYEIMHEAGITIDDVRWYLSVETAKKMLTLKENPGELVDWIHSKRMEAEIYDMEQHFVEMLQEEWNMKRRDEASVREILYRINREKRRRKDNNIVLEKKEETN